MRKVVVSEFLSLDGVMQGPGGPGEDRRDGFEQGGWVTPYFDDAAGRAIDVVMNATDALLLGRWTYELFAGYWPSAPADDPIAAQMNGLPKFVASTTLEGPLDWNNSTLIEGDVADQVGKLKQEPGKDIQVIGSGDLIQTLMGNDLVDEYRLMVFPIVLGSGRRLFKDGSPTTPLRLVESTRTDTGVMIATYQPAARAA